MVWSWSGLGKDHSMLHFPISHSGITGPRGRIPASKFKQHHDLSLSTIFKEVLGLSISRLFK
jgi:hypothetical protein